MPAKPHKKIARNYGATLERLNDPLEVAVVYFGSATALARAVGVRPGAITNWRTRGSMSYRSAKAIERVTEGQVTVTDLESYLYGQPYQQRA